MKYTTKRGRKHLPAGREYLERVAYEWGAMEWGKHHPRLVESVAGMLKENARLRIEKICLLDDLRAEYERIEGKINAYIAHAEYSAYDLALDIGYQNALYDIINKIKNI